MERTCSIFYRDLFMFFNGTENNKGNLSIFHSHPFKKSLASARKTFYFSSDLLTDGAYIHLRTVGDFFFFAFLDLLIPISSPKILAIIRLGWRWLEQSFRPDSLF